MLNMNIKNILKCIHVTLFLYALYSQPVYTFTIKLHVLTMHDVFRKLAVTSQNEVDQFKA